MYPHPFPWLPLAGFFEWMFAGDEIILPAITFLAFLMVLIPLLVCIGILFEKVRIPTYDPEPAERIPASPALDSALNLGFTLLGHVSDGDKGFKKGVFSFALSPDGLVLVRILHSRIFRRIELLTRYPAKRWLLTMDKRLPDYSGLDLIDVLVEAPFETLLQHHRSRMVMMSEPPLPFAAQTAIADAREHFRDRIDQMARLGLARYVNPGRSMWKHTFKASLRHFIRFYLDLPLVFTDLKRTKARRQELEWGMQVQPPGFLVGELPPSAAGPTAVDSDGEKTGRADAVER